MNKQHFPIFKTHPDLVYLDNAATAQKPKVVINRIKKFYEQENANVHRGLFELSERATNEYENARQIVQKFINANSIKEVIFTSGTTDSINLVGYSWIWKNVFAGDSIMTTQMEHHSNFIQWQQASIDKEDVEFVVVKVNEKFELDLEDLEDKLTTYQPRIFAVSMASNVLGTINPIKKIVDIKNRVSPETLILVDAAQSIPHIPTDVQKLGIDFLAFSGHKIYGPTGIGILWGREEILDEKMSPYKYGGGMIREVKKEKSTWAELPEKFEGGTPNIAGAIGLGEAINFVSKIGYEEIIQHEKNLMHYFLDKIGKIKELKLFGPNSTKKRTATFSFDIKGTHPHDVSQILSDEGIAVRSGHHCAQVLMESVLKVPATTRASFGMYNDEKDVDKLIEGLKKVVRVFN